MIKLLQRNATLTKIWPRILQHHIEESIFIRIKLFNLVKDVHMSMKQKNMITLSLNAISDHISDIHQLMILH